MFSKKPFKVLEIPGLEDEYYHNVLAWSSQNKIAVVLANTVFILDNDSGNFSQLYEAYDCEEISSLAWNPEGTMLAIGNILGEVMLWDLVKQDNTLTYEPHNERIGCISWG